VIGRVGTEETVNALRGDLKELGRWSESWQMKFSIEKCKVMHLGSKNAAMDYFMEGRKLEKVKEEKDLGILVNNTFKVSSQCVKAAKKANQILGLIKRTITCKKKDILLKLYKSLVRPHLEYCIQAWRPHFSKDIEVLERVQRRATRMMEECRGRPYEERLKLVGLTTLERRRERADLIEVFKILNGLEGIKEETFFRRHLSVTRGHSMKLSKDRVNKDVLKYSFAHRVIDKWNRLPEKVINAKSINNFKNKIDAFLRDNWGDE
jgi:ribonuclease P/MRP protein subunit RPP40